MPVRFDCHGCGEPWWAPPANGCPRCGYEAVATPDPAIWAVGHVPGTPIFLTAQLRDAERFTSFVAAGIETFVDAAGDAPYVWRPDPRMIRDAGVCYLRIPLEDTNVDLPDDAFSAVASAVSGAKGDVLLFCAAGLKRSPHLLYGVLRAQRHSGDAAWALVSAARPITDRFEPYVQAAERWVSRATTSRVSTMRPRC